MSSEFRHLLRIFLKFFLGTFLLREILAKGFIFSLESIVSLKAESAKELLLAYIILICLLFLLYGLPSEAHISPIFCDFRFFESIELCNELNNLI